VGEEDYRWPELQRLMRAFSPTLYTPLWQARHSLCACALRLHKAMRCCNARSPAHALASCVAHAARAVLRC
jgi:hypothetical protein